MAVGTGTAALEWFVHGDRERASTVAEYEEGSEEDLAGSYPHPLGRMNRRHGQDEARAEQNGRAM